MINKSLVWIDKNNISLVDKKIKNFKKLDGILVKVKSASICGSDIKIIKYGNKRVKKNRTMGHEIAGEIINVSKKVKGYKIGDAVSIGGDISCGNCNNCRQGNVNNCKKNLAIGHQYDGGFAKYIHINDFILKNGPISKFNKNKIDFNTAALAEPLACCLNGVTKVGNFRDKIVCIIGSGPIGIILGKIAKLKKAKKVIMCDINNSAISRAKKIDNFFNTLNINSKNWFSKFMGLTQNNKSNIVFTACNDLKAIKLSLKIVSKNGYINFFGGVPQKKFISLDPNFLHYNEISLTGSHGSTPKQHKFALKLLERKKINLKNLITHKFSLSESLKAITKAKSLKSMKVVINP